MNTLILTCTADVEMTRVISRVSTLPPGGGAALLRAVSLLLAFSVCRKIHIFTDILLVFLTHKIFIFLTKFVLKLKYYFTDENTIAEHQNIKEQKNL